MKYVKNRFSSEKEKMEYVDICEAEFEARLDEVSDKILSNEKVRILTLSGPTCSCKTTTVKKIVGDVIDAGKRIKIISIDDFFLSRDEDRDQALHRGEKIDFDSIDALDFPYFCECYDRLIAGEKTMLPIFDFVSAKRSGYVECDPKEFDIIAFEGIQAIYPEIREKLREHSFMSMFISVGGPVEIGGQVFTGREIRFARRMVRDYRFRNARAEFTMFLWESVVENEEKNLFPYAHTADIQIDSFIPYELNVIKEPLEQILLTIPPEDKHYVQARELLKRFETIEPISANYLPRDSMYREFLG